MIDIAKLRGILALAKSPTEWIEVDQRTLVDMANEIEAARAVVEAAEAIFEYPDGNVPRAILWDALAAYRAHVGGSK